MRTSWTISNMICSACVMHLEALEDELEGVISIQANYHKQRMQIEYDENRIGLDEIRAAVQELGYEIAPS